MHDQIKITLGGHKEIREPYLLEKLSLPKVSRSSNSRVKKSKSTHEQLSLSKILRDPNNFISSYFADINNKLKWTPPFLF